MALDLDELEAWEREQNSPASIAGQIVKAMATGLSEDALAGLLNMSQEEFDELSKNDPEIQRALALGDAKLRLYLERLALVSARDNSNILLSILRSRLGWDQQSSAPDSLIVEVKRFIDASKKEDTDPE